MLLTEDIAVNIGAPPTSGAFNVLIPGETISVTVVAGGAQLSLNGGEPVIYTWDELSSLLDDDTQETWLRRASLAVGALEFLYSYSLDVGDVLDELELSVLNNPFVDRCDMFTGTPPDGVLAQGDITLTWIGAGELSPGDDFDLQFNHCWLDEPGESVDDLLVQLLLIQLMKGRSVAFQHRQDLGARVLRPEIGSRHRVALAGDSKRFLERVAKIQSGMLICVYCLSFAPALLYLRFGSITDASTSRMLLFFFVVIVLLSDGSDNASYYDAEDVIGELERRHDLVVFTIALGKRSEGVEQMLKRMAKATQGKFFDVESGQELRGVFFDIRAILGTEAVLTASALRLRPILMTTFATVLGVFPLLIASGAGANSRSSIGLMIAMGMLVRTLFTLFVVPVFYLLIGGDHEPVRAETAQPALATD